MGQIVVGYDGSDCSRAALDEGRERPRRLGDEVVVVFGYAPPGLWGGEIAEHEDAIEERGAKVMEEAKQQAAEHGVEVEVELVAEARRRRRCRRCRAARRADDRRRQLWGSAVEGDDPWVDSDKLLHLAERPVLVVPAQR